MNLIYISNTRVPSEKANTYQSMVMCEAFSNYCDRVEFWYPDLKNTKPMNRVKDVFKYYDISNKFNIVRLKCFDNNILSKYQKFHKLWFTLKSLSFAINYIVKLKSENSKSIVFTRDSLGLRILSKAKKYLFIKQKIYFEAHIYSKIISDDCNHIDGLVVINNHLKTLYEKDGIKEILVAHDGVRIDTFKNIDEKKAKVLLNLDEKSKYLTYIGRFNTMGNEKGIPQIIESLKYISDENIKLLFVGGPLDNIEVYNEIARKNNININRMTFVDRQQVSELYKFISSSSVLLMPFPWSEHYAYFMSPLKMFEYMASKRVIVASKLPSIEEVLIDKKNAIICEPDNPKDLANKIKWILNNDCDEIVRQAYEDVQQFTWEKRANNIVGWIKKY